MKRQIAGRSPAPAALIRISCISSLLGVPFDLCGDAVDESAEIPEELVRLKLAVCVSIVRIGLAISMGRS
jgi:hypothetical protein